MVERSTSHKNKCAVIRRSEQKAQRGRPKSSGQIQAAKANVAAEEGPKKKSHDQRNKKVTE
eukprot:7402562-Pyramimonas_sp.AAC.1